MDTHYEEFLAVIPHYIAKPFRKKTDVPVLPKVKGLKSLDEYPSVREPSVLPMAGQFRLYCKKHFDTLMSTPEGVLELRDGKGTHLLQCSFDIERCLLWYACGLCPSAK